MAISVIIPVYNVLPYLRESLDSVINQSFRELEILLIDDGSTDGSGDVCEEYARRDSRITVIHRSNGGLSAARNTGLERMTGEYVAFLDSDDAYAPDALERLSAYPEADIVICGISRHETTQTMADVPPKSLFCPQDGWITQKQAFDSLLAFQSPYYVWNKLYRRELWDDVRFPEGFVYEDICTTYKILARAKRIRSIPDALIRYRIRPESISHLPSIKTLRDRTRAYEQFFEYVHAHTPAVFDERQLRDFREALFWRSAKLWAGLPLFSSVTKEYRRDLLEMGRSVCADSLKRRSRFLYRLLRFCPALVRPTQAVYSGYRRLGSILRRTASRLP